MNLKEAKNLIASYLTGRQVSTESFREACRVAQSESDYVRHLRHELGLHDDWLSDCEIFLANAAELSEMSRQEREREMPEMAQHLAACDSCRRAYWSISPWVVERADLDTRLGKKLAERIALAIDDLGRLFERGSGPPARSPQFVAGTMSERGGEFFPEEADEQERRKLWLLSDEENDLIVQMEIEGRGEFEASLVCSIQRKDDPIDPNSIRIEVRDARSGSLHLAGRLSDLGQEPLILSAGSWLIRLQATGKALAQSWEIPIELGAERKDG